ncbi:MAG TPA: branched-chain amino acid ABC transporter permease [Methylomirabilota bacterium]|nr:branched-chain amino acid ABC transporter permease [Methylomirabilota bacterium]
MNLALLLDVAAGGLLLGGLYALVAVGLNLQYGLMRVLNVAHGEFLMIGGYVTYLLHVNTGMDPLVSLLVSGPLVFVAGVAVHTLLYRRLLRQERTREELEANSLLISFGLLFILQNGALLLFSADIRGYQYLDRPLRMLGGVFPANRVVAFLMAAVITALLFLFLRRTLAGAAVRALMQDPVGARLVGVRVPRVHALCFGLGAGLAAVSGSLLSMLFELTPFVGLPYTITALVVVILGGLGSVGGSLLGGLILGVVETLGVYFTAPDLRMVISYGVLAIVLVLRPYGLFNPMARRAGQSERA